MFPKHYNILIIFLLIIENNYLYGKIISDKFPRFEHPAKSDGSLSIMVVGDWGRRGHYNQSDVAHQMGIIGEKMDLDFIISTGDNFYPEGLINVNDPAFDESFTNVYTASSLQKQWYSVLGNHDYRGDALAQLSPLLNQKDSKWFCLKSYILDAEIAEFFFIDTTPFQDKYFTNPGDEVYDWRGVLPRDKYLSTLLKDLDSALVKSSAKWKIVVGHHTIRSAGIHGNTQELVQKLLPILQANNVDLYINGHDHCLEHISSADSPLQFLTSGGGSKSWRGSYNWPNPKNEMLFYYDGQGFMTMKITQTDVEINFYDILGHVMHQWSASKSLIYAT
ncbi:purple acid phosphatase 8-like isoform X2 [Henckelia pumila]|uniref:purple acid phosphatase 8-like isoform X2 n=1 Tax=Henckelia pumila TaxID=405737 RepID=UPI003C6E1E0C